MKRTGNVGNIGARSCNYYCNGKINKYSYSECVFVALGIQHVMRMRRIAICGLLCYTIFFYII